MTKLTVLSNPRSGREDEFNTWYDEVHVPDLLAVPGVRAVSRYKVHAVPGAPAAPHGYLAIYELDGDPDAVLAELAARGADGRISTSDALDAEHVRLDTWEPLGGGGETRAPVSPALPS